MKRLIFPGFDRPILFFKKLGVAIYEIQGVDYYSHFSFPSGHSTTAFALFVGLSLFIRNIPLKLIFLLLACITAFSRVYLSQHFLEDILAGSALGTITVLYIYYIFNRWNKNWLDKNALQLIGKKNDLP
jgi:membrane-associated phospholipid phosphatase